MSDFLTRFYPGDAAMIGAAAVLVQIAVVVVAAATATRFLGRTAALRHAVWLGALGCVLVSPLLAVLAGRLGMGWLRIESARSPANVSAEQENPWDEPLPASIFRPDSEPKRETTEPAVPSQSAPFSADGSRLRSTRPTPNIPKAPVPADPWRAAGGAVTFVWLAGAAWMLLRLLDGVRRLARLRHGSAPLRSPRMESVLNAVRRGLGVDKMPPIRTSPAASGPVAVGVLFPFILLPEGLADALDDAQLRDVLIHENAHLLRRDPLVGLLQRLAAALFWLHPLLPYLNRRLARAREEVCDDFVLRAGDAASYARTLLLLSERGVCLPAAAPGLLDPKWKLEDRVAGLLDPRRTSMTRVSPFRFAGLAVGLLAVCTAGAVVCVGGEPAKENKPAAKTTKAADAATTADPSQVVVEGVVVDEQGKPVADAVVRLVHNVPPVERAPVHTGADGSYRFVVPEGLAHVPFCVASAENGGRQGVPRGGSDPNSLSPIVNEPIVLKPSRKMTVRVTDVAKKPVEGATVGFIYGRVLLAHAETDAHGEVSARLPRDAEVSQVVALKPGVGFDYFESKPPSSILFRSDPPAEAALTLDGARTLTVRAVDSANKPLPGVELYPDAVMKKGKLWPVFFDHLQALKSVFMKTGPDGAAAFDWLPVETQGKVRVFYAGAEYSLSEPPSQAPAPPYETLTAKLSRNTRISGKVTLPDGKPAAGVRLQVAGSGHAKFSFSVRGAARTNADGGYALLVCPDESYMIAVTDDQWAAPSKTGIVVKEGEPRDGLDFRLGKGTLIRGQVKVDTAGIKGRFSYRQPIELIQIGGTVAAPPSQTAAEELRRLVPTDKEGRYAARVGPGRYQIRALIGPLEDVTVKDEETIDKDVSLRPLPVTAPLKGVVLADSTDGKPVAGAFLQGKLADQPWPFGAVADDKGRFVTDSPAGKRFLYARNPEGTLAALVSVRANENEVKVVLKPAGKLTGRIVDKSGQPLAANAVFYSLRINPQTEKLPQVEPRPARVDGAGRFTLPGIVPGAECRIGVLKGRSGIPKEVKVVPATKAETVDLGDLVYDP